MSVTIQLEGFDTFAAEARGLLSVYEQELPLIHKIRPDWPQYQKLWAANSMRIVTARDEGMLVGYFVLLLSPNLSCAGETIAFGATLYLHPEYRNGTTIGVRLIKLAEETAKAENANTIIISSPEQRKIDPLLLHRGYAPLETMFGRRL
jgi:hypothetical protein